MNMKVHFMQVWNSQKKHNNKQINQSLHRAGGEGLMRKALNVGVQQAATRAGKAPIPPAGPAR